MTGTVTDLYTECDGRPVAGAERSGDGRPRRVLLHRPRHPRPRHADQRPDGDLLRPMRTGRRSARSCSRVEGPNGIGLSPDCDTLYWAETTTGRVFRRAVVAVGQLAEPVPLDLSGVLYGLPGMQYLDSLAVDGEGWVCAATLFNGGITAISPDGTQVEHHATGDLMTTNICFGGDDLRTAVRHLVEHRTPRVVPLAPPRPPPRPPIAGSRSRPAASQPTGQIVVCVGISEERPSEILTQTGMDGVEIAWLTMSQRFYIETLGCPKNQVDSDKLVGTLLADGMVRGRRRRPTPTSWSSTPARSSTRPARSRSTPCSRSTTRARTAPRLVVTGCMAERYGDELAAALPEVDRSPASAVRPRATTCRPRQLIRVEPALPALDLLNLPRPRSARAVGLREDRRGLRPGLRVLRHPAFRGPAAQPRRRRRSSPRSTQLERARDRARRPGPGVVRQGRPGSSAPGDRPARRGRRRRVARVRLLYLYPSRPHRRADRRDLRHRRAVLRPVAAARVASRCCAACAAGATATGSSPHRRHPRAASPTPPSARNFIVGYPGETEADHDQLLAFVERRSSTGAGSSPTAARTAPTPPTSTARSTRTLDGRAPGRAARAAGRHHRRAGATRSIGTTVDVLVDAPGVGRTPSRGARDRRHRPRRRRCRRGRASPTVEIVDALGPDLVAAGSTGVAGRRVTARSG